MGVGRNGRQTMTTRTQEVFIKLAEEKFSFLLEKGFIGPVLREVWPETMIYYMV